MERRMGRIHISKRRLLDVLRGELSVVESEELQGAEVVNVGFDIYSDSLVVAMEGPHLPVVGEGEELAYIRVDFVRNHTETEGGR